MGLGIGVAIYVLSRFQDYSIYLWKLRVGVDAYGHYLAGYFVVLAAASAAFKKTRRWRRIGLAIALAALYLLPTFQAREHFIYWKNSLIQGFGPLSQSARTAEWDWRKWADGVWAPELVAERRAYATPQGGEPLHYDYFPATMAPSQKQAPWIVVVHGGGWDSGNSTQLMEWNAFFTTLGYAVISLDYRLAPQHLWPAQREDLASAIRNAKQNAVELQLDPDRYFLLGRSAGGQIALQYAYSANDPALKGVVSVYAPTDLAFGYRHSKPDDVLRSQTLMRNFLGGNPEQLASAYENASPLQTLRKAGKKAWIPPTLFIHGLDDPLVWYRHSERLAGALYERGVARVVLPLPQATHGLDYGLNNPNAQLLAYAYGVFFERFREFVPKR